MKQLLLDFTQAPEPTFANFVPGRNAELLGALRDAARGAGAERVLYLWGDSGAGKTHLLKSLVYAAAPHGAAYLPAADFAPERLAPILALDDLEGLPEARQVALFNAFNERAFAFLAVVARGGTRLATGLTYRVSALSDEEKRAALSAHAAARGFALAEEVSAYLLTHARRDMPSLIGALDALDRYSLETGRPITVPLLRAALQPQAGA